MKTHDINERAAAFGMNILIGYKWIFLALVILVAIVGYTGTQRVELDSSNESFLPKGDVTVKQNDRFKELFGNEEFVFIYIEADAVFTHEVLTYIRDLGDDIEAHLPFVKDVTSLTNVDYTAAYDDTMFVEPLIGDEIPDDAATLAEIKRKALSKDVYVGSLITQDGKKTGIAVSFEVIPDDVYLAVKPGFSPLDQVTWPAEDVIMQDDVYTFEQMQRQPDVQLTRVADPRKLIAPALRVILDRHPSGDFTVLTTGIPVMDFVGDQITSSEGTKFGLIAMIASIVLLAVIFRSVTAVVGPFFVLLVTLLSTYGMMGWAGLPVSMTGMLIPPLLLVISVSYSIHVINHFQRAFQHTNSRSASLRYAFEHSAWPCFVTAVTTAMGFASFLIVPMKPLRDIGLACAFGVFMAYILVMVVIPIAFSFGLESGNKPAAKNTVDTVRHAPWLTRWADWVIRHTMPVSVVFVVLTVVLIGFSFKFRVESDMLELMGDRVQPIRDMHYISEQLGGMYSYEVLIELPEEGQAKRPDVLKTVDALAAETESWDSVALSMSMADIVKDLNVTMHNDDRAFYTIPDDGDLIAQYLLLYEMSGGEDTEDWVDYEYRRLRLSVQVKDASTVVGDKIEALVKGSLGFPDGTTVTLTGDVPILLRVLGLLSYGQIKSVAAALVAITLMMMLILKSVKVGLISMVPNVFPVLAITGVMGMLGYPLDIMTILVAPMIIGIAVDDTVHYIVHFKQEFLACGSYAEANRATFGKVGKAIVFTSVILTIGFAIFGLSIVKSMLHIAVLSSVGILSALAADLFITPILFVRLRPFEARMPAKADTPLPETVV